MYVTEQQYIVLYDSVNSAVPSAGGLWQRVAKSEALGRSRGGLSTKIHLVVDV